MSSSYFDGAGAGAPHFRAHRRRAVNLGVVIRAVRSGWERHAVVVDITLAGAGLETDEPLVPGERLSIAFATPTMWDPLLLDAVVAWAHPLRARNELDAFGRPRASARSGVAFDYASPDVTLSMFEMLAAIGYE